MIQITDNGKPTIETGLVEMFGRLVLVTELEEPEYLYHPISKTVQIKYFAVTETGKFSAESSGLKTWLWDGYMSQ
tara:strand:- start:560 stop:784 length:225 start_codon:yes stop_codon:yes gene_type:complete